VQQPRQWMSSWGRDRLASRGELNLAARVSGLLWLAGAATLPLTLPLPGSMIDPLWAVAVVAAFAVAWGTLMLLAVPSVRSPARLSHVSTVLSLGVIAALTHATGGADSPALDYLWFILVYAAFFYTPREALAYWLGCGLIHALPFLYDPNATEANLARELVVVVPIYCLVGGVVVAGRELLARMSRQAGELEAHQRRLAEEQSSLRRVATAVAAGSPPSGIFALVSSEAGRLLGADGAAIVRYHEGDRADVLGRWSNDKRDDLDAGLVRELAPGRLLNRVRAGAAIARDEVADAPRRVRLAAPVRAGAQVWGALVVAARSPHDDVDGFRELNDRAGLQTAEEVLAEIGALLRGAVRDEDVVARIGADEYAVVFVESDRHQALLIADRARRAVAGAPLHHRLRATVSIGLCDLEAASSADEALRRADAALFWAKEHGGDLSWLYDPAVVRELDERQRTRELDRSHALVGLRALARAIDAKDPATQEHSERVATLSARLAAARGWSPRRAALLRDAALLHDVGKIGIPDAILLKDGPLEDEEFALVREHPVLGARIVGDVLEEEQIAWIAGHHERPDGRGYPAALRADELPEGAALLALADAWDVMISDRSYSPPMAIDDALADARAGAGTQFAAVAVEALEALARRGELMPAAARVHQPTV